MNTGEDYVPVRTRVLLGVVVVSDTVDDDSTDSPEHLQHLGSRGSQLDWRNLTAVRRCVGNEDTPWNSLEQLGDEHDRERVGEVEDEDESVEKHETGDGRPTVSDAAGKGTSQANTDDSTKGTSHLKR